MKVKLLFRPRDIWVGLVWYTEPCWNLTEDSPELEYNIYISLIPCLSLRLRFYKTTAKHDKKRKINTVKGLRDMEEKRPK